MPITFQVNLQAPDFLSNKQPYNQYEAQNFPNTRVAYFPDLLRDNFYTGMTNGTQFTVSGEDALYLLNNYTKGPYAFLTYISGEAP